MLSILTSISLDARYVNKLEDGKFNLSVPTLDKLIEAFGMSYSEFFEFDVKGDDGLEKVHQLLPKKRRFISSVYKNKRHAQERVSRFYK